jgi:hypothetical protein
LPCDIERLAGEPLHIPAARAADAEQLDCDGLSELQVFGTIGLAHCSSSEETDDAIAGGKDVPGRKARIIEWAMLDQWTARLEGRLRRRERR